MYTFDLHIFSNSTVRAPDIGFLIDTYTSFCKDFKVDVVPTIWVDPKPNTGQSERLINNIKNRFNKSKVNVTESLSDGYIKAINQSATDFMIMLEHDWLFLNRINHTLEEIFEAMKVANIVHLRFNKRKNQPTKLEKQIYGEQIQINSNTIDVCVTKLLSNNPHIIDRKLYLNTAFKYIKKESGSHGIEHNLNFYGKRDDKIKSVIYGKMDQEQTIKHLDGRNIGNRNDINSNGVFQSS